MQAWKKIEETKRKADEVQAVRVRNTEQNMQKEQLRQQREQEVAQALERNLQDKAQRENARSEVKQIKFQNNA